MGRCRTVFSANSTGVAGSNSPANNKAGTSEWTGWLKSSGTTPRGQIARGFALDEQGRYIVPSGHRFTFTVTVDARVEKGLRWGTRRLAFIAEGFNLLGLRSEVEENAVSGPSFRESTAFQPPRVVKLGLRLEF